MGRRRRERERRELPRSDHTPAPTPAPTPAMAARLAAKRAGARARRGAGGARPQALLSRGVLAAAASAEPEVAYCQPEEVNGLLNKGYAFLDIRSFEEMEETNTKYGSKRVPLAAMNEDGDIVFNQFWLQTVKETFPNTMSRIILVCDDGTGEYTGRSSAPGGAAGTDPTTRRPLRDRVQQADRGA